MTADVIAQARAQQRTILSEVEAKQLLADAGLSVTETRLATSIDEAAAHAAELGYPVALKVVSDKITHKTDVGGVELGVADEAALRAACQRIHERVIAAVPDAQAQGVSVQPMAEPGVEVILGVTQDQQFGPVLMFGLGGVFVEVLKDVAFRIVPLEPRDAAEMIRRDSGLSHPRRRARTARRQPRSDRGDAAPTLRVRRRASGDRRTRSQPGLRPA